eukprot:TRINITY_DN5551_c0_g1_i2.p1 TRINITY_DN5551_c0_g1~~TRINITY_DN5551_c0_g1_i2.p1  ORF type:complete len:381 (-),score=71.98 TRINITY_DN5551_c0_g1_i2:62-1204(-)
MYSISKLFAHQPTPDELFKALQDRDLPRIRSILAPNRQILFARDPNERTPLHLACRYGNVEAIEFLLQEGAEVHARDSEGRTVLHALCQSSSEEAIKAIPSLIRAGVPVQALTNRGSLALHYLVENNSFVDGALLYEVLTSYFDISNLRLLNLQNYSGETPLHRAAGAGLRLNCLMLLKANADINVKTTEGDTPLLIAAKNCQWKAAMALLEFGADPFIKGSGGSCVDLARKDHNSTVLNFIQEKFGSLEAKQEETTSINTNNNNSLSSSSLLNIDKDVVSNLVAEGFDSATVISTMLRLHNGGFEYNTIPAVKQALRKEDPSKRAECCICLTNIVDSVILPCRHSMVCNDCGLALVKSSRSARCPICRNPIDQIIKFFQ